MFTPFNLGDLWDPARDPNVRAVVDLRDPTQPRHYTHGELDAEARGVARLLRSRGLLPGQRVGILSNNRAEYLSIYSGITRAGLVAVPLNQKAPAELVEFVTADAALQLIFVENAQAHKVPKRVPAVNIDDPGPSGFQAQLQPGPFETWQPDRDDIAEVLYTSGSTGRPKGVPLTHAGQLWMADRRPDAGPVASLSENTSDGVATSTFASPNLPRQNVAIIAQPLFHMAGLLVAKRTLRNHDAVVILPSFDARQYLQVLADYGVSHIQAVPTVLARLIKEQDLIDSLDLSRLSVISLGSAPMTVSLFEKVRKTFPQAVLTHGYGSTEGGGGLFGPHPDGLPTPPIGLGVPLPGIDIRLVDGPDDDHGVMLVRSPGVMTHYLNLPEVTERVFREGWYYTGDVLRRDSDGFYFFVGRADDMFVCAGENIYPSDVEKTLERHPDVHQACVVPLPDEDRGQVPVAFIVSVKGREITAGDIRRFAQENGPIYQYPRRVAFVPELPWAGTDKIDRHALKTDAQSRESTQRWAA